MKKSNSNSGQSLIEFALILIIALPLVLGFLDLGRAVFYYSSLTHAVREGTRFAIVDSNPNSKETTPYPYEDNVGWINRHSFGIPDLDLTPKDKDEDGNVSVSDDCYPGPCTFYSSDFDLMVTITRSPDDAEDNLDWDQNLHLYVKIQGTYTFKPITPGIKQIFGSVEGIDLVVRSQMVISPGSW